MEVLLSEFLQQKENSPHQVSKDPNINKQATPTSQKKTASKEYKQFYFQVMMNQTT